MKVKIIFISVLTSLMFVLPVSAESFTNQSHMSTDSSNVKNLLAYAMSYESFTNSDYVIFQSADNTYQIVWGDLEYEDNNIKSIGAVDCISYYRTSSGTGYNNIYKYNKSDYSNFNVSIDNYVVATNVENAGLKTEFYEIYKNNYYLKYFNILIAGMIFAILFKRG